MSLRLVYKFTNRRMVREAIRLLRRNFPEKERLGVGVVVLENQEIIIQVTLQGRVQAHEEVFIQGILSAGKPAEVTAEAFATASLEAPEVYLGAAAFAFPMSRPGERAEASHGGD